MATTETLPRIRMVFDADLPGAVKAAEAIAARGVKEVSDQTILALRTLVVAGIKNKTTVFETARSIVGEIGLTERQAMSVNKFRIELINSGLPLAKIDKQVARLVKKKIRQRATTIARTETMRAINAGKVEGWKQAQKKGLLEPGQTKEWEIAPGACPVCEPMQGVRVPLEEDFGIGDPPLHPRCRCTVILGQAGRLPLVI